ncbi:MAG: aminotransferase class I/II-fold pyridoxal phosphate-dependent enzyme, partial [Flavobacteriales bacterium]|nr:aminotransferase class I/II-fold pyridoxal phosphate-dependent enzyme [Flavobacteriales bacterium]
GDFQIEFTLVQSVLRDENLKLIFICTPNNPTGNIIDTAAIKSILDNLMGIVLIDEAYIDFSEEESWLKCLSRYPNLIISQTFSKAWGLAAARVGTAFSSKEIIDLFNKVKPPYNVSGLNQKAAIDALVNQEAFEKNKSTILSEKQRVEQSLSEIPCVQKIYPSNANFILIQVTDANGIYDQLVKEKIITRNRNNLVRNCIRITIGSPEENSQLLSLLKTL